MRYTKHTLKIGLSNLRKDGSRSVMLRVSCLAKRTDLYTGISVAEKQWNDKTKRVKHGCTVDGTPYNVLNDAIDTQISFINDYFTKVAMQDLVPSLEELKRTFNIAFKGKVESIPTNDFFLLFDTFIEKRKETRNWEKSFYQAFKHLRATLYEFNPNLTFSDLSEDTMNGFVNKLAETLHNDALIKRLFYFKQFVKWALGQGYPVHKEFFTYDRKLSTSKKDVRFLYPDELDRIYKLNLEEGSALDQVRDCFVFACHTALRHSDLKQLTRSNITPRKQGDGYEIKKLTEKDEDIVYYKLSKVATDIYLKYKDRKYASGRLLPVISNQKYNEHLKKLGELAELEGYWYNHTFKLGDKEEIKTPRTNLTSHVARRTFIVMAYNEGIPLDLIALVTSHNDVKAMKPYLKATSSGADKVIDAIDRVTVIKRETDSTEESASEGE